MSYLDGTPLIPGTERLSVDYYKDQRSKGQLTKQAVSAAVETAKAELDAANVEVSRDELQEYVALLNEIGLSQPPNLQFQIDDDTGKTVIKMTHGETGELLRQIPSEEFIRIAKMVKENEQSLNDHPGQWVEVSA